jgi:hypothetical protein
VRGDRREDQSHQHLPTTVTGSTIAMLNDTCGNRIQIAALNRWMRP